MNRMRHESGAYHHELLVMGCSNPRKCEGKQWEGRTTFSCGQLKNVFMLTLHNKIKKIETDLNVCFTAVEDSMVTSNYCTYQTNHVCHLLRRARKKLKKLMLIVNSTHTQG